ncbi:hypothetical protein G7074_00060 [Pedobacter sp. HDW13]|uniref:hypothetical protein n=1 Tax=unclassified Pedobacter TaxID=2628915 RepID=UPI000F5B430C|nr:MULTISPECIES: hypothetical protein [unclassified Pedobacter]QIL37820.1 hypothetical protein G7074_00060 [Pedobacter sp. HDW13]RQO78981.1 hypothetical protein DBR40_04450 [Pedobacter sp. KBW01]
MIGSEKYLEIFSKAVNQLNQEQLKEMQLEVAVVEVLDCVCVKIFKKAWCSPNEDPLLAKTRIFFSVWISEASNREQKLLYNIHAFKLRHLAGYTIESRKFADSFRYDFKTLEQQWPNVSIKYGPLTLMEGWVSFEGRNIEEEILVLANNFLSVAPLVDTALAGFKS